MIARFGIGGNPSRSCAKASNPPADAPTPTMPKSAGGLSFLAMPLATGRRARLLFLLSCTEQQPAKRRGALLEILDFLVERGGEGRQPSICRAGLHAGAQLDVFFDGAQRAPERLFELFVHPVAEAFAIEPMPDVAAVTYEVL